VQAALSRHKLAAVQIRYSLVDRTIERGLLPYCQQQRISILAFSALGLEFWRIKQADPEEALEQIARETGKTEAQVALNWLVSKDQVVALAKASTVPHALEDCEAGGWRLTPGQLALLDQKVRCRRRGWLHSAARYCNRYVRQSLGRDL
jgi:diketogulonate reductase-like aldo/keto reductase